jgi:hypothetical protein
LLLDTPYNIKEQVHEEIGDIVVALEDSSRSVLYSLQSLSSFLDVKDNYKIPEVFDQKNMHKKTVRRCYTTQFCIGVNYWYIVHINKDFYYTTLSCLVADRNDKFIQLLLFPPRTEFLSQCILEMLFVSVLLFTIAALIQSNLESESLAVSCQQKHATPR